MIFTAAGRGALVTELLEVSVEARDSTEAAAALTARRNELIVELRAEGLNTAQLAQLTGLTRQRIHQLTTTTEEVPECTP